MDEDLLVRRGQQLVGRGLRERKGAHAGTELVDDGRRAGDEAVQREAVVLGADEHERLLVAHAQRVRVRAHVALVALVVRAREAVQPQVADLHEGRAVHVEQLEHVVVLQVQRLDVPDERLRGSYDLGVLRERFLVCLLGDVLAEVGLVGTQAEIARVDPRLRDLGPHATCLAGVAPVVEEVELRIEDAIPKRIVFVHGLDELKIAGVVKFLGACNVVHGAPLALTG